MQFTQVLKARVSTRDFETRPVPESAVKSLLDAALYAPVGMHMYDTLHLSVITNPEILERIRLCVAKASGNENADPLHNAPLLIVVSVRERATSVRSTSPVSLKIAARRNRSRTRKPLCARRDHRSRKRQNARSGYENP